MRLPIIFSIIIGLSGCQSEQVTNERLPIMGDLVLGNYAVGYKTLFTCDQTRNGVPYSDWDGNLTHNHQPELGRQFQINLWYPAESGSGERINYSHYLYLSGQPILKHRKGRRHLLSRPSLIKPMPLEM